MITLKHTAWNKPYNKSSTTRLFVVFDVLCVDVRVVGVNEVVLVYDDVVGTPLRWTARRCCKPPNHPTWCGSQRDTTAEWSVAMSGTTCSQHRLLSLFLIFSLSLDGPEHPESVHDPLSVVLSMKEVTFIDLDYGRLPIDIEASELLWVSPQISIIIINYNNNFILQRVKSTELVLWIYTSIYIIRSSIHNTLSWKAARVRHAPLRNLQWRQLSTIHQQYKVGILIFDL